MCKLYYDRNMKTSEEFNTSQKSQNPSSQSSTRAILSANEKPRLEKPGAGLPWAQAVLLRFYVGPFVAKKARWEDSEKIFNLMNQKIIEKISDLNEEQLSRQVLVQPLPGIEDSSRYWSVAMTMKHIMIVADGMSHILKSITHEKELPVVVDVARVKPPEELSALQVRDEFIRFSKEYLPKLNLEIGNREARQTHVHPWFGKFTARQWLWLLSGHSGIHYRQIKEIIKNLSLI